MKQRVVARERGKYRLHGLFIGAHATGKVGMSGHDGDIVGQFGIGQLCGSPQPSSCFQGIGSNESISVISVPTIVKTTSESHMVNAKDA
jgi:hypothetical protein